MKIFKYKAKNAEGNVIEDTIQAGSREEAVSAIRSQGLQVLTVKNPDKIGGSMVFGGISVSEKSSFCRFMATMLRSGMSLPEAVDIIREGSKNKRLNKILSDVSFQTQKGKSLSMVLSQYESDFDQIFLTMIKVGEESGTLDKAFDYLSKQLSASHELKQKVTGSLMYPAVIILAMFANGLLMMLFVLPKISQAFLKLEVPLPIYTKWLLIVGEFFGNNVLLVFGVFGAILGLFVFLFILQPTRSVIMRFITKLPIVRDISRHIDVARFSRTLSTLLRSGVPILEALDVSVGTLGQRSFKREAKKFSESVSKGESLSDVLVKNKDLFPPIMVQTIKAGEQSGSLENVLEELAVFYEKEVDYSLKRFTSLLEPVLMLLIGAVVGVMVIMMIAPIYSIIGGLQSTIQQP